MNFSETLFPFYEMPRHLVSELKSYITLCIYYTHRIGERASLQSIYHMTEVVQD